MTRSITLALGMIMTITIAACETTPTAGGSASMAQAIESYNARRHSQAHQQAVALQNHAAPGEREDAAYIAGLAAYHLGDPDEAERRLLTASRSASIETVARSKAMLGQIRMDQNRPRDAATFFVEAYPQLAEEDAHQCAYNAAVAYQQSGDSSSAKQWLARSGYRAPAPANPTSAATATVPHTTPLKPAAASSMMFTLQVGAFREKNRAQQAAGDAEKLAARENLGPVKILTRRDERNQMMYVVQFGSFVTREAAAAARARIGKLQYIVAPASAAS